MMTMELFRLLSHRTSTIFLIAAGTGEPGMAIAAMIPCGKSNHQRPVKRYVRSGTGVCGSLQNIETVACDLSAGETFAVLSERYPDHNVFMDCGAKVVYAEK